MTWLVLDPMERPPARGVFYTAVRTYLSVYDGHLCGIIFGCTTLIPAESSLGVYELISTESSLGRLNSDPSDG